MPDRWTDLRPEDRSEALQFAAARSGRPPHLLEKDIWVVWALAQLYPTGAGSALTFKGGTSLSKVHRLIDRFSEDIDLTCDIRALVPDILEDGDPLPRTREHSRRITKAVRASLPRWIAATVVPALQQAAQRDGLPVQVVHGQELDVVRITYPALAGGTGYASPTILLEFGARATGEPNAPQDVTCDLAPFLPELEFPIAQPLVMSAERTFWEKITAAHVYCAQHRLRGERFARHWFDIAAYRHREDILTSAVRDHALAKQVATHKAWFFPEKSASGLAIDYHAAVTGGLQIIPNGPARVALAADYEAMRDDGLLVDTAPTFDAVLDACADIQRMILTAS